MHYSWLARLEQGSTSQHNNNRVVIRNLTNRSQYNTRFSCPFSLTDQLLDDEIEGAACDVVHILRVVGIWSRGQDAITNHEHRETA